MLRWVGSGEATSGHGSVRWSGAAGSARSGSWQGWMRGWAGRTGSRSEEGATGGGGAVALPQPACRPSPPSPHSPPTSTPTLLPPGGGQPGMVVLHLEVRPPPAVRVPGTRRAAPAGRTAAGCGAAGRRRSSACQQRQRRGPSGQCQRRQRRVHHSGGLQRADSQRDYFQFRRRQPLRQPGATPGEHQGQPELLGGGDRVITCFGAIAGVGPCLARLPPTFGHPASEPPHLARVPAPPTQADGGGSGGSSGRGAAAADAPGPGQRRLGAGGGWVLPPAGACVPGVTKWSRSCRHVRACVKLCRRRQVHSPPAPPAPTPPCPAVRPAVARGGGRGAAQLQASRAQPAAFGGGGAAAGGWGGRR